MQSSAEKSGLSSYVVPFLAAFVVFCVLFVLMDTAVMHMQGLSLMYNK